MEILEDRHTLNVYTLMCLVENVSESVASFERWQQLAMHAVIRKRQGLPWEKELPKGLRANLKHLTDVAALPNFEPLDPDSLNLAHGALQYPKLVAEISSPLLEVVADGLERPAFRPGVRMYPSAT